jgi:cell division protein ZapE
VSVETVQSPNNSGPRAAYKALLAGGELSPDPGQAEIVTRLQTLREDLGRPEETPPGFLASLFGKRQARPAPRGLYIHGGVGRGKSMLMDLFFETAPVAEKRRVHFHAFMLECHGAIHKWRGQSAVERSNNHDDDGDPIPPLARRIAADARLLCFDEFQVSDVADAMILGRLFGELLGLGVVLVATSNRAPDALYEGGLNRALFLPFIDLLQDRLEVMALDGPTDYRLRRMKGVQVYHVPINDQTTQHMREAFFSMTDRDVEDAHMVPTAELQVQGRALFVPKSSKGVAVFSFKRLCADPGKPLGAADYLAIAWRYHTVFIVAIPRMGPDQRNEAKRFVTLIDTLYENNVKLICSAAVAPDQLYAAGDGSFEFSRTASRLAEMQSEEYLARGHAV